MTNHPVKRKSRSFARALLQSCAVHYLATNVEMNDRTQLPPNTARAVQETPERLKMASPCASSDKCSATPQSARKALFGYRARNLTERDAVSALRGNGLWPARERVPSGRPSNDPRDQLPIPRAHRTSDPGRRQAISHRRDSPMRAAKAIRAIADTIPQSDKLSQHPADPRQYNSAQSLHITARTSSMAIHRCNHRHAIRSNRSRDAAGCGRQSGADLIWFAASRPCRRAYP